MYWHPHSSTDRKHIYADCTQKNMHLTVYCFLFFPALMDPITLSKTANTVPYGEPIVMVIQLFLMDTLSIMNLGGKRFSRQIATHVVNVDYANVRCREVVVSREVGGVICFPV